MEPPRTGNLNLTDYIDPASAEGQSLAAHLADQQRETALAIDTEIVARSALDLRAEVSALWDAGLPPGARTGWPSLDRHYTVAPGQLTLVTGWPSIGKSEFVDALLPENK